MSTRPRLLLIRFFWKDQRKDENVTAKEVERLIKDAVLRLYGPVGYSSLRQMFDVKYWNPTISLAIVRTRLEDEQMVTAALALITEFKHRTLSIETLRASGRLLGLQQAALDVTRQIVAEMPFPSARAREAEKEILNLPQR